MRLVNKLRKITPWDQGYNDYSLGVEYPPRDFSPDEKADWHDGWYRAQLDDPDGEEDEELEGY